MKYFKRFIGVVALALLIVITASALPPETKPQPAQAQQAAFDHSNCQYPDRWSNPVDGCDNSDPAVPECIKSFSTKAGEDACIAEFVAQHQIGTAEKRQAIAEHDAAFKPAQPTEAAQCGGK